MDGGINYRPDFKNQGAFIMAVEAPQIIDFIVEKRVWSKEEQIVALRGVTVGGSEGNSTETVEDELIYGDMLDLHLSLHNVIDYTAEVDILCKGKSMFENDEGIKDLFS